MNGTIGCTEAAHQIQISECALALPCNIAIGLKTKHSFNKFTTYIPYKCDTFQLLLLAVIDATSGTIS